jgi:hypothetical protein
LRHEGKSGVGTRLKSSSEIIYHDRGFTCLQYLICHTIPEFTYWIRGKPRNPELLVKRQINFTHEEEQHSMRAFLVAVTPLCSLWAGGLEDGTSRRRSADETPTIVRKHRG